MDKIKAYIARGREIEAKADKFPAPWSFDDVDGELLNSEGYTLHSHCALGEFFQREAGPLAAHARNHHARLLNALEEAVNGCRLCACREPFVDKCSECRRIDRIAAILEGKDG